MSDLSDLLPIDPLDRGPSFAFGGLGDIDRGPTFAYGGLGDIDRGPTFAFGSLPSYVVGRNGQVIQRPDEMSDAAWEAVIEGETGSAPSYAGGNSGGGGGGGFMDFLDGGGGEILGAGLGGIFNLIQTGIMADAAKNNPNAANMMNQLKSLEQQALAGQISTQEAQLQAEALASQNQALITELQRRESQSGGFFDSPVGMAVAGVGVFAVATLAFLGLSRRRPAPGYRNVIDDSSIFDLDPSDWSFSD